MSKHWIASLACAELFIPVTACAAQLEVGTLDCDISLKAARRPRSLLPT
jgi:hypothetical protein